MVKLIDPDTSFEEVADNLIGAAAGPESGDTTPVPQTTTQENSGVSKSGNLLYDKNLGPYIVGAGVAVVGVIVLAILALVCVKKLRDKFIKKVRDFLKSFFWNGLIRSISLAYLNMCIGLTLQVHTMRDNPEATTDTAKYTMMGTGAFLGLYFISTFSCLLYHRDRLDEKEV